MVNQKVLRLEPRDDFVVTPAIDAMIARAGTYVEAGYAVHFRGSAGTGKTTLALHVAHRRGRPVTLMFGDEEFGTSDLVGAEKGLFSTRVIDNYCRTVTKTEEIRRPQWVDSHLTTACKHGYTLVYDEFSRSRPEANNVLLTVLEERILAVPDPQHRATFMAVHPEFRAIFTSNPEEYAGVHKTQNALLDRMITIEMDDCDRDTEVAIARARARVEQAAAEQIVDLVRRVRADVKTQRPTLRASIMLARIMRQLGCEFSLDHPIFVDACLDLLRPPGAAGTEAEWRAVDRTIRGALRAATVERGGSS